MPEPYRIPGDALELMRYQLEQAQSRIQELEQEIERLDNLSDDLCLAAVKLSKENERLNSQVDDLCLEAATLQADRDNWRAKAGG